MRRRGEVDLLNCKDIAVANFSSWYIPSKPINTDFIRDIADIYKNENCGSVCQAPIPIDIIIHDISAYSAYKFFKECCPNSSGSRASTLTNNSLKAQKWWCGLVADDPDILNSLTNFKPNNLSFLKIRINESLDKGNTVVLFINEPYLNSPFSIYIKRNTTSDAVGSKNISMTEVIINNTLTTPTEEQNSRLLKIIIYKIFL